MAGSSQAMSTRGRRQPSTGIIAPSLHISALPAIIRFTTFGDAISEYAGCSVHLQLAHSNAHRQPGILACFGRSYKPKPDVVFRLSGRFTQQFEGDDLGRNLVLANVIHYYQPRGTCG